MALTDKNVYPFAAKTHPLFFINTKKPDTSYVASGVN